MPRQSIKVQRTCRYCGRGFEMRESDVARGWGVFCSHRCKYAAQGEKVEMTCAQCGKSYLLTQSRAKVEKYCSVECSARGKFGPLPEPPNPSGLCMCGCGRPTTIATKTHRGHGALKGHSVRYIRGHHAVTHIGPEYLVDSETGCWVWQRAKTDDGYGIRGGTLAHRVAYEDSFGTIPDGLQIHHKCRNTLCVNPGHLEVVTPLEHSRIHRLKEVA